MKKLIAATFALFIGAQSSLIAMDEAAGAAENAGTDETVVLANIARRFNTTPDELQDSYRLGNNVRKYMAKEQMSEQDYAESVEIGTMCRGYASQLQMSNKDFITKIGVGVGFIDNVAQQNNIPPQQAINNAIGNLSLLICAGAISLTALAGYTAYKTTKFAYRTGKKAYAASCRLAQQLRAKYNKPAEAKAA